MKKFIIGAILLSPMLVFAQLGDPDLDNVSDLVKSVKDIIDVLIPLVAALALLYFFYGLAKFILNRKDNPEGTEEAKGIMIWGIVALFVMVSVWGLVRFIGDALGIGTSGNEQQIVPGIRGIERP